MTDSLVILPLAGMPLVEPGDDLVALLLDAVSARGETVRDGDLFVVAQKIVSKAENRYVKLDDVVPSARALALAGEVDKDPRLVELILRESKTVVRQRPGAVIVEHRLGYVHANAGIDRSNIPGENRVLLLPEDPDRSAAALREGVRERSGRDVRVIINDSAGRAWRNGITGFAIGCAGFRPLVDRIGTPDLYGRQLEITEVAVADELAAAASFVMGQAAEGVPAVLVRGAALEPGDGGMRPLIRDPATDLFR